MMADAKQDPRRDADTGLNPASFSDRVRQAVVGRREPVYEPRAFVEDSDTGVGEDLTPLPVRHPDFQVAMGHAIITTQGVVGGTTPLMLVPMQVTVDRTPYLLVRKSIILLNNGANTVFLAGSLETCVPASGFPLLAGASMILDKGVLGELWGICSSGLTSDVRVMMEHGPVNPVDGWANYDE